MSTTTTIPLRNLASHGVPLTLLGVGVVVLAGMTAQAMEGRTGSGSLSKALTSQQRARLPLQDFAVPGERKYPINDYYHAQLALIYVSSPTNASYRYQVMSRVFPRYPSLINWWGTTKLGRTHGLSQKFFREKIKTLRARVERQDREERGRTEDEIAALQLLITMAPRLHRLATGQTPRRNRRNR